MRKTLIGNSRKNIYNEIKEALDDCQEFYFIVSFIRFSGAQMLLDIFKRAEERGIRGKIITSNYMGITERKALDALLKFRNIELRYFEGELQGFHPKGYIFRDEECSRIIIGSSNLTRGGLKSNIEWSSGIDVKNSSEYAVEVMDEFSDLWERCEEYDPLKFPEISNEYGEFFHRREDFNGFQENNQEEVRGKNIKLKIEPNYMQRTALKNLRRVRDNGAERALGIAATGTGKTYLAAFDATQMNPKKLLFIAHREEILSGAECSFKNIISGVEMGRYSGREKNREADFIFATVQSLHRNLLEFSPHEFQYIVIDEAHHVAGESYKKILDYFKPEFILGLTATPERGDGVEIYEVFQGNIVMEIRIREALEEKLIAPFNYYGIKDISEIDLSHVELGDVEKIAKKLMIHKRTLYIKEQMEYYGFSGRKLKALGFCVSITHAKFMAEEFNSLGIKAAVLTGENSSSEREKILRELADEKNPLKIIFAVDIFNEGVDIPSLNMVLMLRPTDSPTVFIQQLGRGLRKYPEKEFLTVLDFIGNHKKAFLTAMALSGNRTYDKDSLRTALNCEFSNFSREIHIVMDEIVREEILDQIENENFNTMRYLKEEYLAFKNLVKRVPGYLDYFNYENAPEIEKFLIKSGTYYEFLKSADKVSESFTKNQIAIASQIEGMLPIKRVYEFAIIEELLKKGELSEEEGERAVSKYLEKVELETVIHAFKYLAGNYFDDGEKRRKLELFSYHDKKIRIEDMVRDELESLEFRKYLEEVILYGLLQYEKNFGSRNYGTPFLKLYESYTMRDTALLSNYGKLHSSYRNGVNPSEDRKNYYLFMTLNKDSNSHFDNEIFDMRRFRWYSKSSTGIESEAGKDLIFSRERGVNLHFFMRKFSRIDGITQPFIYLGKGIVESFEGEKPIVCKIKLDEKMDEKVYIDFITKK